MRLPLLLTLGTLPLLLACPSSDEGAGGGASTSGPSEMEQKAMEKGCPTMHSLPGQYIKVVGNAPDHKYRFELLEDGGGMTAWYIDGGFTKTVMQGEKRESDWQFTEVPDARKKASFEAGAEPLRRLYVEPRLEKCALRVSKIEVTKADGKDVEKGQPGFVEYVRFPKNHEMTFRPCTEPVFLYDAAQDAGVAGKQVEELGTPKIDHMLGEAIPVAAWSDAAADGAESCSFDMDLYFDDMPVQEGGKAVPAGDVKDGKRQWLVPAWKAPYSGNHHFEIHRYKTCDGGQRELLGVACLEAVLN
ncbi:MAG: hypothetical protein H6742_09300 [Alphaproteobacteria bacterium]|nr:hypothetical protein [Alphaproteobacteria bacterium]